MNEAGYESISGLESLQIRLINAKIEHDILDKEIHLSSKSGCISFFVYFLDLYSSFASIKRQSIQITRPISSNGDSNNTSNKYLLYSILTSGNIFPIP